MSYGPRAMDRGPRSTGLKYKNYLCLALEAWCLELAAFTNWFVFTAWRSSGLQLGACTLVRYPRAVAHASWISAISLELVFWIGDMLHVSRPAATTVTALVALLGCRAITT